ncbi:MAG: hypothetical protein KC503_40195 [Myxococcales bacterium]|nr:hypothetical protein [Myxococcales bacterium]
MTLTVVIGALLASASAHAEPRGRWRWRGREREQRRVDVNSKFQHKLQLTERIAKQVESSGRGYPTSEQLGKLGSHVFGMLALAGIGMQGERTSAKASEPFGYIDQHSFERMLRVAHAFGRWGAAVKAAEAGGKPVTFQPPRSGALARAMQRGLTATQAIGLVGSHLVTPYYAEGLLPSDRPRRHRAGGAAKALAPSERTGRTGEIARAGAISDPSALQQLVERLGQREGVHASTLRQLGSDL